MEYCFVISDCRRTYILENSVGSIDDRLYDYLLCDLDIIDISTIVQYCDHDRFLPTPVPGAFRKRWILERPKNMPPACFLDGLSNPVRPSKKFHPGWGGTFLAESVGFEPTVPCGITGFQDRLVKPLRQLSIT